MKKNWGWCVAVGLIFGGSTEATTDFDAMTFRVQKLDGFFNTFSVPAEDSVWTLDFDALTRQQEHGKIVFRHKDKHKSWYYPYQGRFRIAHSETDKAGRL